MTRTPCTVAQSASDDFGTQSLGLLPIFPSSNWPLGILYRFPHVFNVIDIDHEYSRIVVFQAPQNQGPAFDAAHLDLNSWACPANVQAFFDRSKIHGFQESQNLRIETQCGHERLRMSDPSHSSKWFLKRWIVWRNSSSQTKLRQLVVPFYEDLFSQSNQSKTKGPTWATEWEHRARRANTANSPHPCSHNSSVSNTKQPACTRAKGLRKVFPFFKASMRKTKGIAANCRLQNAINITIIQLYIIV